MDLTLVVMVEDYKVPAIGISVVQSPVHAPEHRLMVMMNRQQHKVEVAIT